MSLPVTNPELLAALRRAGFTRLADWASAAGYSWQAFTAYRGGTRPVTADALKRLAAAIRQPPLVALHLLKLPRAAAPKNGKGKRL